MRYIFYNPHFLLQISSASSGNDLYGDSRRDRNSIRSARSTAGTVQLCLADHVAGAETFVENKISRAKGLLSDSNLTKSISLDLRVRGHRWRIDSARIIENLFGNDRRYNERKSYTWQYADNKLLRSKKIKAKQSCRDRGQQSKRGICQVRVSSGLIKKTWIW